ncbi:polymeric immunoglobulin receptor-like [Sardina pilchardus]|uniref:polymeric immunoglobulin receptor-like n=1 Tax=Sardina pilchardus TaxID=27697 RepID=UPI002E131C0A
MGSALLKAFVGGAVLFECSYRPENRLQRKYFCKTDDTSCLSSGISHPTDKRISLSDNRNGLFRSLITGLTENDSGEYRCIVETAPNVYVNTTTTLKVDPDPLYMQSIVKSGYVGGDIVFDCPYPPTTNGSVKYFYRQRDMSACPELVSSQSPQPKSRYSLVAKDNNTEVFSVTIRKLTPEDTGNYWCGFRTGGYLGGIAMTTEVKLQILGDIPRLTPTTLSPALAVIIVLILIVAAILFGVMMYRHRVKRRRVQFSASQAARQDNAVSPSSASGAMAMDPFPKNQQVYQNLRPDATPSDGGDHEAAGAPTDGKSEHVYEALKISPSQAEDAVYLTLVPEPMAEAL